jgi:hypothetical protein
VVSDYDCADGGSVPYVLIAGDGLREVTRGQQWIWLRVLGAMFSLGVCRSLDIVFEAIDGSRVVGTSLGGLHTHLVARTFRVAF